MAISAIPQLLTGSRLPILILCTVTADDDRLLTLGEVSSHGSHVLLDWVDGLLCAGTVFTDCTRQLISWGRRVATANARPSSSGGYESFLRETIKPAIGKSMPVTKNPKRSDCQ